MFSFISKIFTSLTLFRMAFYKYKKTILILTILGFISGILGGIGIGAIIPLFSFVVGQDGLVVDDPISNIFKTIFSVFGVEFSLLSVILVLILLFVFKAIFVFFANVINAKAFADYEAETRSELFKHSMKATWPYLIDRKVGYLSQTIVEDVNMSASILLNISTAILSLTSFITYAAVAIGISFYITLATILIGITIFFVLKPLFYKIRKLGDIRAVVTKEVSHHIGQYLIGAKTVKSMAVEGNILEKGNVYFEKLAKSKLNLAKYNSIPGAFFEPLTLAVIIPIFLFSYKDPSFNIASFAAILYLIQKMFAFIQSMQSRVSLINQSIPNLVAVVNYQAEAKKHREESGGGNNFVFNSLLEFKEVAFRYDGMGERVLDGLSLSIKKGEMVGLIGYSGSGKTTMVDLILRLFNPTEGKIIVDGVNISDINLEKWRKNIGYVSQDIFLTNDTIANNIRFYDDSISEEDIVRVARLANIYEFVMEQPEKFNTFVGERGLKLSVGQRQRIVLARVLARNPSILILDEATSALDNESELLIQKTIEGLRGRVTVLAIAHRLSTVMNSDNLLVLDEGRIIEEGVPAELLKNKDSHFYKIYNIR